MKDVKRVVSTGFWKDDLVLNEFTPEDKYFMLYLLTNEFTTQLGIYHLPIKQAAFDLGYSEDSVIALISRFQDKYNLIKYSKQTNEVAIKNYLRHSIVKGGKPVFDCLSKEASSVKDKSLLSYVIDNINSYRDIEDINITIISFINSIDINDNDNERYVNESYHESSTIRQTKSEKHRHGEFKHVLLTDKEHKKLIDKFGKTDTDGMIRFLDEAIEIHGYKYKSHYMVIAKEDNWVRKEYFKNKQNQPKAIKWD